MSAKKVVFEGFAKVMVRVTADAGTLDDSAVEEVAYLLNRTESSFGMKIELECCEGDVEIDEMVPPRPQRKRKR